MFHCCPSSSSITTKPLPLDLMDQNTTTSRTTFAPRRSVNLRDLRQSVSQTRANLTRVRGFARARRKTQAQQPDFITFVSLACEIYRNNNEDFVPVQQYSPGSETYQGQGHTSLVSHAKVRQVAASNYSRGATSSYFEPLIIKRPRRSIGDNESDGLLSFITELRVRTHSPLKSHPNIARLRGIGWDFEDEDATIPRPIMLEELAPQGALDNFWKNWNFVRMTFKSKLDFCRDIADGLHALHGCGIVHGDVKPENILVFPRKDVRDAFMVKLTDFGHSVLEPDGLQALPAFTPQWCAPEAKKKEPMTFQEMISTDCYSYGLVVLSIMIGRAFYHDFEDVESCKANGSILSLSVALLEKEDKDNNDSDIEVAVIHSLLRRALRLNPSLRKLEECLKVIKRYGIHVQNHASLGPVKHSPTNFALIPQLDVVEKVTIGYQTLRGCSHQLKAYIVSKLQEIGNNTKDYRRSAAAWELAVCYFSGFGVAKSFELSSQWLCLAADHGVTVAQDYFQNLHDAMGSKPQHERPSEDAANRNGLGSTSPKWASRLERTTLPPTDATELLHHHDVVDLEMDMYLTDASEEMAEPTVSVPMSDQTRFTLMHGSLEDLKALMEKDHTVLESQDAVGNSPFLVAAQSRRYEILDHLLTYSNADAGRGNNQGQTVLHYLVGFNDSEIELLVPRLLRAKVDPNAEGVTVKSHRGNTLFTPSIRSCSILHSILHKNQVLLESLLEATHTDGSAYSCRVCEAGSAFRRILAVSLSLFHDDALKALTNHVTRHRSGQDIEFSRIEVWAGQELLPLHKVPFHSVAVSAMDLPEAIFRALNYGSRYMDTLQQTINFLLSTEEDVQDMAYAMLKAAVEANSADAVRILLAEGRLRCLPSMWWIVPIHRYFSDINFNDVPVVLAIQAGTREIFDMFVEENGSYFSEPYMEDCRDVVCAPATWGLERIKQRFFRKEKDYKHTHALELLQPAVEAAVNARHQDLYFLKAIVNAAGPAFSILKTNEVLFTATLSSAFKAAEILNNCLPQLWESRVAMDEWYFRNSVSRYFIYADHATSLHLQTATAIESLLHCATYEQCQFVLKQIKDKRGCIPVKDAEDDGSMDWHRCNLTDGEYDALVAGNILWVREDREALWTIIRTQVLGGHPRSVRFLQAAIKCCNVDAVRELVDNGWNPNLNWWQLTESPLQYTRNLRDCRPVTEATEALLDVFQRTTGPVFVRHGATGLHETVYQEYWRQGKDLISELRTKKLEEIESLLISRGARLGLVTENHYLSLAIAFARSSALPLYFTLYALILPLFMVYKTDDVWISMSQSEKFLFVYLWAGLALTCPKFNVITFGVPEAPLHWPKGRYLNPYIVLYVGWLGAALFNNFALPVLVIHYNWQPFRQCQSMVEDCQLVHFKCRNYSFLLPLIIGGIELSAGYSVEKIVDLVRSWFAREYQS